MFVLNAHKFGFLTSNKIRNYQNLILKLLRNSNITRYDVCVYIWNKLSCVKYKLSRIDTNWILSLTLN